MRLTKTRLKEIILEEYNMAETSPTSLIRSVVENFFSGRALDIDIEPLIAELETVASQAPELGGRNSISDLRGDTQ